jgi:hypothetical protein
VEKKFKSAQKQIKRLVKNSSMFKQANGNLRKKTTRWQRNSTKNCATKSAGKQCWIILATVTDILVEQCSITTTTKCNRKVIRKILPSLLTEHVQTDLYHLHSFRRKILLSLKGKKSLSMPRKFYQRKLKSVKKCNYRKI